MRTLLALLSAFLLGEASCYKVRYHKADPRSRAEQEEVFAFLGRIAEYDDEPEPFTTPAAPAAILEQEEEGAFPAAKSADFGGSLSDHCLASRGQFGYPPDCHKFVNCWDSTATLEDCFPDSLVFNPATGQCTWPTDPQVRGRCDSAASSTTTTAKTTTTDDYYYDYYTGDIDVRMMGSDGGASASSSSVVSAYVSTDFSLPSCSDFSHLGYTCVQYYLCRRGEVVNATDITLAEEILIEQERREAEDYYNRMTTNREEDEDGMFQPWSKKCPFFNDVCCKDPNFDKMQNAKSQQQARRGKMSVLCPDGYTGPRPYPADCSKFANCWKGVPTVQACAPGTEFNARTAQCDFPSKAGCVVDQESKMVFSVFNEEGDEMSARSSIVDDSLVFSAPPSGQRARLRGGRSPYSGYLELFHSGTNRWGLACDSGSWNVAEADIVCRQLGFSRGARSTTQGLVHGSVNEERKLTERIDCSGEEPGIEKCQVEYSGSSSGSCKLSSDVVSVTCVHDSFASCPSGEVPWGGACYSVHFERQDFSSAQQTCQAEGKRLVEITTQQENDLLSELLVQNQYSEGILSQMWTGGLGSHTARVPLYYWHGSRTKIDFFRPWWPGWSGERKPGADSQLEMGSTMAVKLSRKFQFTSGAQRREERLVDYYFWTLEDLRTRLAFICERPQKDIGCVDGDGSSYNGFANRGESGDVCAEWDTPELAFVLDEEDIVKLGPLAGNNFCRNPDGDSAPWCIAPNGEFDYCDIPECPKNSTVEVAVTTTTPASPSSSGGNSDLSSVDRGMSSRRCSGDQFQCRAGGDECVLSAYVCDGQADCSNGRDEDGCDRREMDNYVKRGRTRLDAPYVERWLDSTARACAGHCRNARGFVCRSFGYHAAKRLCTLSEDNVGTSGRAVEDAQWDLYESRSELVECGEKDGLTCGNGKCVDRERVCDGKDDCGDKTDEQSCAEAPDLTVRLVGGSSPNEGRVEIKAFDYPFGGVCDDGFGKSEADVICKEAGFALGAREAATNSRFGHGAGPILVDELKCSGGEGGLLDCKFQDWGVHDCTEEEWAGVVCKTETDECSRDEEWQCGSGECVPLDFLCDGRKDCADGSDERQSGLCDEEVEVRLAGGGNNATSGRLEVRFKGVWGTVCDDNFGEEEGAVACRMAGFEGRAIVHSEASFGPGSGPIWIQNIACRGNEKTLEDCRAPAWQPTYQCKHVEDVGVECIPFRKPTVPTAEEDEGLNEVVTARLGPGSASVQCGQSSVAETPAVPVARIAGGLQSRPGANPWAASVRLQGSAKSFHWCGAVVLSEFHVLTVAHCMEDYPKDVYRIRVGDWDMQVPDLQEQEFTISAVHFHEEYNVGLYLNNDIAVVRVNADAVTGRGIRFGERVVPACLPPSNTAYGPHLNCSVSGWGSTGVNRPGYTRYLQSATLPLLRSEQCMAEEVYGPNKLGGGMFCAGFLEGGVDTCQGDSGGGMVCEVKGRRSVLGLTSWGYGCGRPNRPGVYTKVADYLEWIVEKMTL